MRRTRAIGIVGVVIGLSGCAGTHHHHHHHAALASPGVARPAGTAVASCGCGNHSGPSVASRIPPPPPAAAPTAPRLSSAPARMLPAAAPGRNRPPSSRPIPVPAPSGVARYFPPADVPPDRIKGVLNTGAPDLLGVRTWLASEASPVDLSDLPPLPPHLPAVPSLPPLSSATEPAEGRPRVLAVAAARPLAPSGRPRLAQPREVVPVSAEFPAPAPTTQPAALELPVNSPRSAPGGAGGANGSSISLEYADEVVLQGRPRWQPPAPPARVEHDPSEPSKWVSELAFTGATRPAAPAAQGVKRASSRAGSPDLFSRFLRRFRSAGRAFFDPDLVGREAGDFPQGGDGIQRASAHRLHEPTQR